MRSFSPSLSEGSAYFFGMRAEKVHIQMCFHFCVWLRPVLKALTCVKVTSEPFSSKTHCRGLAWALDMQVLAVLQHNEI